MEIEGKVCVVTGAASGIGRAVAQRFATDGASGVVVADVHEAGARAVAEEIVAAGGRAIPFVADVGTSDGNRALIDAATAEFGPVDVFHANAGVASAQGLRADDDEWDRQWRVNTMAHVWAVRQLVPEWRSRGEGYFISTASMAGILTSLGDGAYAATKHAAVGFAEWLAITYGGQGVHVSCLCPGVVRTGMLPRQMSGDQASATIGGGDVREPEDVAAAVVDAMRAERFLILSHPEMQEHITRQAADRDRWIGGMQRLLERGRAARRR